MTGNLPRPYRIMLVIADATDLDAWIRLASSLCLEPGEIRLRGMVTIPPDVSLSEGAIQAQQFRDTVDRVGRDLSFLHNETEIRVDYHPLARLLEEIPSLEIDLLLVQWAGPTDLTGGLQTDEITKSAPCDVVLISGSSWREKGSVLLSLRGGPNLTLGIRVATALAGESAVTLFHAADRQRRMPTLSWLMEADTRISRIVTALTGFVDSVKRESAAHKAIVMGASPSSQAEAASKNMIKTVYEQVSIPLVLVRARSQEDYAFHVPQRIATRQESLSTRVDRWFAENTFHSSEFADLQALLALKDKQGVTISVGLPALNEEKTVGNVIETVKRALMDEIPLVDEIVLIDSDSTDNTVSIAQSYGVPTYKHPEILPEVGSYRGKGEALWKSLAVLKGDIIAWIDTDITNIHPRFIYGLLGPLLKRPQIQYVKGFYQRPIQVGEELQAVGGGRVTELVARPLLNLFYPELSGIIQPLSGEYAGRRTALESIPFFSGYGVEIAMLIDMQERFGLDGFAQVDLEERIHHNQPLVALSKMSFAIHQVFISRLEKRYSIQLLDKANRSMKLIAREPERFALDIAEIGDVERPPMITMPAYNAGRNVPATVG